MTTRDECEDVDSGGGKPSTLENIAALFEVSTRGLKRARRVLKHGVPELARAAQAGHLSLAAAESLLDQPADVQRTAAELAEVARSAESLSQLIRGRGVRIEVEAAARSLVAVIERVFGEGQGDGPASSGTVTPPGVEAVGGREAAPPTVAGAAPSQQTEPQRPAASAISRAAEDLFEMVRRPPHCYPYLQIAGKTHELPALCRRGFGPGRSTAVEFAEDLYKMARLPQHRYPYLKLKERTEQFRDLCRRRFGGGEVASASAER